jgi:hypothetical protein
MGAPNLSLNQLYSKIVSSPSFKMTSFGRGWVTTAWGLVESSGPNFSYEYVTAQFVLVFLGHPTGYVQANYNLQTGTVTVDYNSGLLCA